MLLLSTREKTRSIRKDMYKKNTGAVQFHYFAYNAGAFRNKH